MKNVRFAIFTIALLFISFASTARVAKSVDAPQSAEQYSDAWIDSYWENGTDTWTESDSSAEIYLVWGNNGTIDTWMAVIEEYTISANVSMDYAFCFVQLYVGAADVTDNDTFSGGEAFYTIGFYATYTTYNMSIDLEYTWFNIYEYEGELYLGSMINGGFVNYGVIYDEFFDSYAGNQSIGNLVYGEFDYGYVLDQAMWFYMQEGDQADAWYAHMFAQWDGYTVYDDLNKNDVMDYGLIEDPLNPGNWTVNMTAFEPLYNLYYIDFDLIEAIEPVFSAENGYFIFGFYIQGITVAIVPWGVELFEAMWNGWYTIAYCPVEYILFYFAWNTETVTLGAKHGLGSYYEDINYIMPKLMLNGLSLAVDYWGYFETAAASVTLEDEADGNSTEEDVDGTLTWSSGGIDVIQIEGVGTYDLYNTTSGLNYTLDMTMVLIPIASLGVVYEDDENTIAAFAAIFVFSVCIPRWGGCAFIMDPTFTAYTLDTPAPPPSDGPAEDNGGIPGYTMPYVLAASGIGLAIIIKRKR